MPDPIPQIFDALVEVSMYTNLHGEVDNYADVVNAVREMHEALVEVRDYIGLVHDYQAYERMMKRLSYVIGETR